MYRKNHLLYILACCSDKDSEKILTTKPQISEISLFTLKLLSFGHNYVGSQGFFVGQWGSLVLLHLHQDVSHSHQVLLEGGAFVSSFSS